jgi:predicted aspartyl protease
MRKAEVTRSNVRWWRFFSSSFLILLAALVCTRVFAHDDPVEFPLPEYDDVILIPVTLGNADRLCVLDSGATYHFFHTSLRESLGKQLSEAACTFANGESMKVALYPVPEIKIGRITLPGSKASVQDDGTGNFALRSPRTMRESPSLLVDQFDPLEDKVEDEECVVCCDSAIVAQMSGRNIEGTVGMPLFLAKVVQLDFDHRRIRILPATTSPSSDWGQPINVSFNEGKLPTIDVELPGGVKSTCIVDTGCDGTISLSSELFAKLVATQKIIPREDGTVFQANGIKVIHVGRLASAKIGDFENASLEVDDGGKLNSIGLQYLRRFLVTLDLGRKQIYLKKGAKFDEPDKEPAVRIGLLRKNEMTIVGSVGRNGPGERAGIQLNDELVSVGGEPVRGKPTAEIRWSYREKADANRHLTLAMRRDGVERNVDVEINK